MRELEKFINDKNIKSVFYWYEADIYFYDYDRYFKLQKTYSDSEILKMEKYILKKYTTGLDCFIEKIMPKIIFLNFILSRDKFIVDDELFEYYKAFYNLSGLKMISKKAEFLGTNKKILSLYAKNLNILEMSNAVGNEVLNYFNDIEIFIFFADAKVKYFEENFYNMFIDRWSGFGVKKIKDMMDDADE